MDCFKLVQRNRLATEDMKEYLKTNGGAQNGIKNMAEILAETFDNIRN